MHFIGLILNDQSMDAFHVFTYFDLIILNSGNVCQSFHTLKTLALSYKSTASSHSDPPSINR